ncbi:MAG: hypothetical protein EBU75_11645, partial [Betaproteobacteria bacterium]|nr:hypothetical protein [Betaproteobacteria bacterium]
LSGSGSVPDRSAVSVTGTFDLNDVSDTVGSIAGAGSITLGSATLTSGDDKATGSDTDTTFSGVISGTGGIIKQGDAVLTLSNTNTYTGKTTISLGKISVSVDTNLGTAPTGSAVADQLTLNGGTLLSTGTFTLAANRGVTLGSSDGTIEVSGSSTTLTVARVVGGKHLRRCDDYLGWWCECDGHVGHEFVIRGHDYERWVVEFCECHVRHDSDVHRQDHRCWHPGEVGRVDTGAHLADRYRKHEQLHGHDDGVGGHAANHQCRCARRVGER